MADFQWREKVRNVQNSTKEESKVPEGAKSLGFGCFTIGMMLMTLFFTIIAVGMFAQHHPLIGAVSAILALGIGYMTYKLIRADKLP